ncbi:MAG: nodulation S family protein, partial [Chloroflexota bacterium]|nr:nodulation S family protein [Chloroflexota bacterium]
SLPQDRYTNAFEIGCSIGVLTERLAPRCDRLLAVDVVPGVLAQARQRCARFPQVRFAEMSVPATFPGEQFDLIVLSEIGYYWSATDLATAKQSIANALTPAGHLVLVHWTPFVHDYPLTGDQVHEAFLRQDARSPLSHLNGRREERYRLDVLERRKECNVGNVP